MSIHLSEHQQSLNGLSTSSTAFIPDSNAFLKPANTGWALGVWLRTPPQGVETNVARVVLSRDTGGTGGNDAYLRFAQFNPRQIECALRSGGSLVVPSVSVSAPDPGTVFLAMMIQTASNFHLVTCVPGAAPTVTTVTSSIGYTTALLSHRGVCGRIGSRDGNARHFFGDIENLFFLHGLFPESAGVPDVALIESIADGTVEISDIAASMTSGDLRVHYPMLRRNDYGDATGSFATGLRIFSGGGAVIGDEDADVGRFYYSGGHLRPGALRPTDVGHWISPLTFSERGNIATATATIRAEGGTYHGITPAAIQARLVKEDGTAHVDWTVVDPAPSSGSWGAHTFPNVASTPGYLELHFRAVDGAGNQIGNIIPSKGLRGTGFAFHAQTCQSQFMYHWQNATGDAEILDVGVRLLTYMVTSNDNGIDDRENIETMHSRSNPATRNRAAGIGWAANEINVRFPGYPIQMVTIGHSGESPTGWRGAGKFIYRWTELAQYFGIPQPDPVWCHGGHSSLSPTTAYQSILDDQFAFAETALGPLSHALMLPTPRYQEPGAAGAAVAHAREEIRAWSAANAVGYDGGSYAVVEAGGASINPHPSGDALGQGRGGSLMAMGMMAAQGAIAGPAEIKSKTASGTSVALTLGEVNT